MALPPPHLRKYMSDIGIQMDFMDTVRHSCHLLLYLNLLILPDFPSAEKCLFYIQSLG